MRQAKQMSSSADSDFSVLNLGLNHMHSLPSSSQSVITTTSGFCLIKVRFRTVNYCKV